MRGWTGSSKGSRPRSVNYFRLFINDGPADRDDVPFCLLLFISVHEIFPSPGTVCSVGDQTDGFACLKKRRNEPNSSAITPALDKRRQHTPTAPLPPFGTTGHNHRPTATGNDGARSNLHRGTQQSRRSWAARNRYLYYL